MEPIITFPMLGDIAFDFPNYFSIFGFRIYFYGVIIACGFLLAVAYCFRRIKEFGPTPDDLLDTLLFATPLAIIGARAYYVIFYGNYTSFYDMINIRDGGLAIYGGLIVAALTVLVVCRVKKISALAMLDCVVSGFFIGQSIGRWGNFANREAYGYETDVFCRMGLTVGGETIYVHPCFLYESLWNAAGFVLLHILGKKTKRKFDGQFLLYYVGWYGLGRAIIEGVRTDSLYIGSSSIRVSQLIAAVSVLVAAVLLTVILKSGKCRPEKLFVNQVAAREAEALAVALAEAGETLEQELEELPMVEEQPVETQEENEEISEI